jgi:hypothetical protein
MDSPEQLSPLSDELVITLAGEFFQQAISPDNFPFNDLERFPREVAQFILGSNQGSMGATSVKIGEGSIRLMLRPPESVRESLIGDLVRLSRSQDYNAEIDPVRSRIMNRWQRRADIENHYAFRVEMGDAHVSVNASTGWKLAETEESSHGEYMVLGEVDDAGGDAPNIHVTDSFTKERLIVAATRDQIRGESHPVYNRKLLHVSAERSLRTGKLNKIRLLRFVPYAPRVNEELIKKMLAAGRDLFAGVQDAERWVAERRGADAD